MHCGTLENVNKYSSVFKVMLTVNNGIDVRVDTADHDERGHLMKIEHQHMQREDPSYRLTTMIKAQNTAFILCHQVENHSDRLFRWYQNIP